MKYLFVLIFIVVFILFGVDLGYTTASPLYTHITYMFQHAGIIHLLINSLAFVSMFRQIEKYVNKYLLSLLIILCAFASSFLAMFQIPTVGASSMVYAMLGIYSGLIAFCDKIKIADTRKFLLYIFCILIVLSASYFKHNSNFLVHVYSLIMGFFMSIFLSLQKKHMSKTIVYVILVSLTILAIWAIIIVGLDLSHLKIGHFENSDKINSILINLSYSFIAGLIFYILVTQMPYMIEKKRNDPVIASLVNNISKQVNISIETYENKGISNVIESISEDELSTLITSKSIFDPSFIGQQIMANNNTTNLFIIKQTVEIIREEIKAILEFKKYLSSEQQIILNKIRMCDYFNFTKNTQDTPLERALFNTPEVRLRVGASLYELILFTRELIATTK